MNCLNRIFLIAFLFLGIPLFASPVFGQTTVTSFSVHTTLEGQRNANKTVTATLYSPGGSTALATGSGSVNTQGDVSFSGLSLSAGTYDIALVSPGYLNKRIASVSVSQGALYQVNPFSAGDITGDGAIDLADITQIRTYWGTANTAGDINQDGIVNSLDSSFINKNWSRTFASETIIGQPQLPPPTENVIPRGRIGLMRDPGVLNGWAVDPNIPNDPVRVRIYLDGTMGTGELLTEVVANTPRPNFLQDSGFPGDHGFTYSLPTTTVGGRHPRDGRLHKIYVYMEDKETGTYYPIRDFPYTFGMGDGVFIAGVEETVYDHDTQACEDRHIPDMYARAIRNDQNQIVLYDTNETTFPYIGSSFSNLTPQCGVPALSSPFCTLAQNPRISPDPSTFSGCQYIGGVYTENGSTVYALLHNEFHAERHADTTLCPSGNLERCWYAAVTSALSTNGGRTFSLIGTPPDQLVAAPPYQYSASLNTRVGYGMPSNIIKHPTDGYYYSFIQISPYGPQTQGNCLIRTNNLADPKSWRAWDGSGFSIQYINPYVDTTANPADHVCTPILYGVQPKVMNGSVTFNTYLNAFVAVSRSKIRLLDPVTNTYRIRVGWFYSISQGTDITKWGTVRLIAETNQQDGDQTNDIVNLIDKDVLWYPSLIDHDHPNNLSLSRNFEYSDDSAYIYFTRTPQSGTSNFNRDLERLPVYFTQ